jgi:hypothetical protein
MREAAGSKEGVTMVVVSDPRQVTLLLLMCHLSLPYGGVGMEVGGRLAS